MTPEYEEEALEPGRNPESSARCGAYMGKYSCDLPAGHPGFHGTGRLPYAEVLRQRNDAIAEIDRLRAELTGMVRERDEWLDATRVAQDAMHAAVNERERIRGAGKAMREYADAIMLKLATHGPSIVPHLLDTDENDGQRLRRSFAAWDALEGGAK